MPILTNPKHERFAQELAKGKTADEAYVHAGYKKSRFNAARLNTKDNVRSRVEEILSAAAEKTGITIERVIGELAKIGFANMADYMRVGPDGDPYLDFGRITRDQAAALIEVTVEDFKEGRGDDAREVRRVKFKLADKKGALVDLGRHLGGFVERKEVRVGALDKLNADDRDRVRDAVRRELERRSGRDRAPGEPRQDQSIPALH